MTTSATGSLTNETTYGYLSLPQSDGAPGVLVLHAWWGLTDFFKAFCDRLASEGFVVLAPDLFAGKTADTVAEAEALVENVENKSFDQIIATVEGAIETLRNHEAVQGSKIGIIGFSFGAAYALLAAAAYKPNDVGATVLFYGNHPGLDADNYRKASSAFLGHFAADDPYESAEDMEHTKSQMEKAGREVTFHTYADCQHWFFEANRPGAYSAENAQLAWERTLSFLRQHL
jgi:carboxymethylenebutenolidase